MTTKQRIAALLHPKTGVYEDRETFCYHAVAVWEEDGEEQVRMVA